MYIKKIGIKKAAVNLYQIPKLFRKKQGQALTEYGLVIALIAILVISVLTLLGSRLVTVFNKIIAAFPPS